MEKFSIIDLTHPIHDGMPVWPGDPPSRIERATSIEDQGYLLNCLTIGEHSGTHAGAPRHFIDDGADMAGIPADRLILLAVKMDASVDCRNGDGFLLSKKYLLAWELTHGTIPPGSAFILETGWSEHWSNAGVYFGRRSPGLSLEAVRFLTDERAVGAVGIDGPGVDGGMTEGFTANKWLSLKSVLHIENLTGLSKLPVHGAWLFIGALPLVGGSGSPARILAMVPADGS